MPDPSPEISIVVPVYNEEATLEVLYAEIVAAMEGYGHRFEIVAVDDGSRDGSFEVLKRLQGRDPRLRVIRLARNFGQNPAMYAGFAHVQGRTVVTIDADLQNPPAEIPKLLEKLAEGHDIVQGWREGRQDSFFRRTVSRLINGLVSFLLQVKVHDLGCGMKAYRREVIERLSMASHRSRYLPAEAAWLGADLAEVKVAHRPRSGGDSKYGILSLVSVNFDMLASISSLPVRVIGMIGLLFSLAGFAMGARVAYVRLAYGDFQQLTSVIAIFFVLAGVQMGCTGIMCGYISRIYTEVQARPYYIVGEVLGDGDKRA